MQICEALGLGPRQVIALVGAGGKTTLMFRLAAELAAADYGVVTSTTTRLAVREVALAPACIACEETDRLLAALPDALRQHRHVLAVECVIPEKDRVGGLTAGTLACIAALSEVDYLIVEADGSRERPLKAPADHEPSIPPCATIVIPLAGLDVIGRALDTLHVHRPELVAELAQVSIGAPVTAATVAAVLGHPQGGLKNVPPTAAVIPFLNKAETTEAQAAGAQVARLLLAQAPVEQVLIGAVATADPVRAVYGHSDRAQRG